MNDFKVIECPQCRCNQSIKIHENYEAVPTRVQQKLQKLVDFVKEQANWKNSCISHYKKIGEEASELLREIGEL